MYPGVDYGKLAGQSVGATGQFTQGIDPDWTALAHAYGFIQNPFPAMGTEGQDQMRFLATLKNIMDAQLGGQGGAAMQMSPNNPIAAMPFGMRQWFSGAGPLFNSIQGRMLMPSTQDQMFANGYQFGGLDTSQSNALMQLLASQRSGQPVGQNTPANAVAPASGGGNGQTPAQAQQVAGGNTPSETPPSGSAGEANSNSGLPSAANNPQTNPTQSPGSGQADIVAALQQADAVNSGQLAPGQEGPATVPPPLQQAWNAFMANRDQNQAAAKSKELDFWTNPVLQNFADWFAGAMGQQGRK